MSIRGPQALASLDEAMRDIRREEDEISRRLARSAERLSKMRESEAELFRQLAQLRLDPSVQSELDGRISLAESKAREMLKDHARHLSAAEEALAGADAELAGLTEQRAAALAELEARQSELKELGARLQAQISVDPAFVAKRQGAEELADIAAQSIHKTEQAEADQAQKGSPYRNDPLFMYLWNAGYGTARYRTNNLVRLLDGWVADLIGFHKARPNFAMLNELPMRLREHAERQIARAEQAQGELDRLEQEAIDEAGGRPLREALGAVQARIEAIDSQIMAAEDRRDAAAQKLGTMAQGRDPSFAEALDTLATELGREDIQTLLAEARQTRTGRDDTIVAQIDDARARMKEEDAEVREQKARLKTLAARRRELEDIQWEFKKQRFDDPRSSFGEDRLVGDMLNDFLRGGISAAAYWEHWRRSQNWNPGTTDWGGGEGLPNNGRSATPWPQGGGGFQWPDGSFGGGSKRGPGSGGSGRSSSGGGSFSRPRSGSSGTRKHGGFKTGGGF